ncbi:MULTISPECIES: dihydrofolate reductase [Lactobacillus]|uniref:Dihydrofolate reductase n=1 Tax=Lactobacillus xujianguonis TaxID=2495899 RepID=A0A437ST85_9LACO|nr:MULTISPECIES: dihydrofolate reductase [Lactobacillus]RVU70118.1 dihydrofolate reductase [Lactobacillus xujianguonis]RVU73088.1 dihydrofolate reductase [Lactobacillus xujianguonis]
MITYVWAEDQQGGIGYQGHLPWRMPADLHHFKEKTMGHPILMGRKTFASLPKLLPGRKHLVLTHNQDLRKKYQDNDQVSFFASLEEVKDYLADHQDDQICVIGGVSVFQGLLDQVDVLEKTFIDHTFKTDTKMPAIDYTRFKLINEEAHAADAKNLYPYTFLTYQRNN